MKYNHEEKQDPADIKPGIYSWTCVDAAEKIGKNSGCDYINVKLAVNIPDIAEPIHTYDILSSQPKALWKVEQFCKVAGLDFAADELNVENCLGKQGRAKFVFGAPKANGRKYLEVERYIINEDVPFGEESQESQAAAESDRSTRDYDVPF